MKKISLCLMLFLLIGCTRALYNQQTVAPAFPITDSTKTIVIIDFIDDSTLVTIGETGIAANKKKANMLKNVKLGYFPDLVKKMNVQLHIEAFLDTSIRQNMPGNKNNIPDITEKQIKAIINRYNAAYILVFNTFSGGFDRNRIEKTRDVNAAGTTKTAYDSIFCTVQFDLYNSVGEKTPKNIEKRVEDSHVLIGGGMLDIGSFKYYSDALKEIAKSNMDQTIQLFEETKISTLVKK